MKLTTLLTTILTLALVTSCADLNKKPKKITSKDIDLNATSAPINGYNYYNLPSNTPKMEKQKEARNTLPPQTTAPAKVKKTKAKVKK